MNKQWAEAERRYDLVIQRYADSKAAPEAVYWKGVSRYKATNDHTELSKITEQLKGRYAAVVSTIGR